MDHPFLTQRHTLARAREGVDLVADANVLKGMGDSDRALFAKRREALVADPAVRDVLGRRATRLGLLVEDLEEIAAELKVTPPGVVAAVDDAWTELLTGGKVSDALFHVLDTVASALQTRCAAIAPLECDASESSYSDYSDSRTLSTSSDGSDGDDMSDDGDDG